jgi:hypothetical protein
MRFLTSFFTLLLLSVSALALNINVVREDAEVATTDATTDAELTTASLKPKVCNPFYKGSDLAQKQYEALADYADLFVNKQDVLTAFNRYIPGYVSNELLSLEARKRLTSACAIQCL